MCGIQIHRGQSFRRRSMKPGPITWSIIFWRLWIWRLRRSRIKRRRSNVRIFVSVKSGNVKTQSAVSDGAVSTFLKLGNFAQQRKRVFVKANRTSYFRILLSHAEIIQQILVIKKIFKINVAKITKITNNRNPQFNSLPDFHSCGTERGASPNGSELSSQGRESMMLVLKRGENEKIVFQTADGPIVLVVCSTGLQNTKLGISAPRSVQIFREELLSEQTRREVANV